MFIKRFFDAGEPGEGGGSGSVDFAHGFTQVLDTPPNPDDSVVPDAGEEGAGGGEPGEPGEGGKPNAGAGAEPGSGEAGAGGGKPDAGAGAGDGGQAAKPVEWRDAIKDVPVEDLLSSLGNRREILKALKVPDFIANLDEHYEKGGDPSDFIAYSGKDYSKMTDDQVISEKIRMDNAGAPDDVIETLIEQELAKYPTDADEYDEKAIKLAEYQKKKSADGFRKELEEIRQNHIIPGKKDAQPGPSAEQIAETTKSIVESDITKSLIASGNVRIGGDDGYNFVVKNPTDLVDYATGKKPFFDLFIKEDGSVDLDLFYATTAYAMNRPRYDKEAIAFGYSENNKGKAEGDNAGEGNSGAGGQKALSDWDKIERGQ